jgi:hypothetical protein
MAWSVDDLSTITQLLIDKLNDAILASPQYILQHFPYKVSGLMPGVDRLAGNSVLSLYLLHVSRDPYWRNTPVTGSLAQLSTSQPLSLNLSYLLTSYSETNWALEQLLMSIALEYFHANPIYRSPVISPTIEFTITVEADTIEEMSRLWQAIAAPIRLSSLFRVAVVFLKPVKPPSPDARPPVEVTLSVAPDLDAPPLSPLPEPQLFSLAVETQYRVPPGSIFDPDAKPVFTPSSGSPTAINTPPVVVAGQTLRIRGSGLNQPDAASVYITSSGSEWPLDLGLNHFTRLFGTSASGTAGDADELVLEIPSAYAALPAPGTALTGTPLPAAFTIAVGNAVTVYRSNTLPITFAPAVINIGPGESVLTPNAAGIYTLIAHGLIAGLIAVKLDETPLTIGAAAAPGVATIDAGGNITFMLTAPAPLPSGAYTRVRIIVNGIEAPPSWWVLIP